MNIKGSVALVTGANRGLGSEFVKALLDQGARKVYAATRAPERLAPGDGVVPLKLDVTDQLSIAGAAALASDVTLLINNAGIHVRNEGLLTAGSLSAFRQELETNVLGTLGMSQAFAPILGANGGGAIVNVLSALSWLNIPTAGTYSATKSAAWSITNGLRLSLLDRGTLVVGVHVGFMDTDMTRGLQVPKVSPADVANATLEAVQRGETEVLADRLSADIKSGLSSGVYLRPLPRG
jgi:NAD(P)-dependent dehydrogenase (short-subunit alcohol dehydrogenase family)